MELVRIGFVVLDPVSSAFEFPWVFGGHNSKEPKPKLKPQIPKTSRLQASLS
jgi:hypothetical protein